MPLSTPAVPLAGHPDSNPLGHLNRRARSRRQSNSLTATPWPPVSKSSYDQLARGTVPPDLSNLRLRRLCVARNLLGQSMMALANVMHDHRPGQAGLTPGKVDEYARVWQEARRQHEALEKAYLEFPLTFV